MPQSTRTPGISICYSHSLLLMSWGYPDMGKTIKTPYKLILESIINEHRPWQTSKWRYNIITPRSALKLPSPTYSGKGLNSIGLETLSSENTRKTVPSCWPKIAERPSDKQYAWHARPDIGAGSSIKYNSSSNVGQLLFLNWNTIPGPKSDNWSGCWSGILVESTITLVFMLWIEFVTIIRQCQPFQQDQKHSTWQFQTLWTPNLSQREKTTSNHFPLNWTLGRSPTSWGPTLKTIESSTGSCPLET